MVIKRKISSSFPIFFVLVREGEGGHMDKG